MFRKKMVREDNYRIGIKKNWYMIIAKGVSQ